MYHLSFGLTIEWLQSPGQLLINQRFLDASMCHRYREKNITADGKKTHDEECLHQYWRKWSLKLELIGKSWNIYKNIYYRSSAIFFLQSKSIIINITYLCNHSYIPCLDNFRLSVFPPCHTLVIRTQYILEEMEKPNQNLYLST